MFKMPDVLYAVLTVFRGYCLQYFLGSFLEGRMKSRWNGLCVAVLYAVLRMAVMWVLPPGYEDYKVAVGTLASSLCMISFLALCFYKAFRLISGDGMAALLKGKKGSMAPGGCVCIGEL